MVKGPSPGCYGCHGLYGGKCFWSIYLFLCFRQQQYTLPIRYDMYFIFVQCYAHTHSYINVTCYQKENATRNKSRTNVTALKKERKIYVRVVTKVKLVTAVFVYTYVSAKSPFLKGPKRKKKYHQNKKYLKSHIGTSAFIL